MALTITTLKARNLPDRAYGVYSILLDNSYPAGGYAVTAANLSFDKAIDAVIFGPAVASSNYLVAQFDPSTSKLRVFMPVGGTAASPTTVAQPVAVTTPDAGATGLTGSAAKPALTAVTTPGAGKECAAATDLSAFTVIAVAFGS